MAESAHCNLRTTKPGTQTHEDASDAVELVVHELRAPLTVIAGYLELLSETEDPATQERAVASAREAAARMRDMLDALAAAGSPEDLLSPNNRSRIDLYELAAHVIESLGYATPQSINLEGSASTAVLGDRRLLEQALINLLTNASNHTPDNSEITVTVEQRQGAVCLMVTDEGPGIPPDARDQVFERYARLEPKHSPGPQGMGLGLYIVRTIVKEHGGSVIVEAGPENTGARFVISVPAASQADSAR